MNFFRTTYTLCTKFSALTFFVDVPLWRVVLHTVLLLLLCSLATASCSLLLEYDRINSVVKKIDEDTGGFHVRKNQLVTGNDVTERHYVCDLHAIPVRVDYFGTEESVEKADPGKWDAYLGLALTPSKFYLWSSDGEKYISTGILEPALLSTALIKDPDTMNGMKDRSLNKILTRTEFQSELKKSVAAKVQTEGEEYPCNLGLILKFMLWIMVSLYTANQIFLLAILAILVLPLIEMFRMRTLPHKLPYRKLIALTLYATFPGFIAASVFEVFASNILSFQTVFFIVFIIYQLFSFGRLVLFLNPQLERELHSDDDIDDDDDF